MNDTGASELYPHFHEPVLALPYLAAIIIIALPLAAFAGFRLGQIEYRRRGYDRVPPRQIPGETSISAMLALLGLLLGFAFSSALGWREARQSTLVNEAMAISTAFLTADLLEDPGRTDLQRTILVYAQTRLAEREDLLTRESWNAFVARSLEKQAEIWPATLRAFDGQTPAPIRAAVAGSVTRMLDAHTQRIAAGAEQVPPAAKIMIFLMSAAGILTMGNRSAIQGRTLTWRTFAFAGALATVMIVIFDLDRSLEGTVQSNPDTLLATIHEMERTLAGRVE